MTPLVSFAERRVIIMKLLEGKIALVTGAAMGNGLGIARVFAEKGAVVVMADMNEEVFASAERLKAETGNDRVYPYIMDVSCRRQVREVVADYEKKIGGTDILVNNAGISLLTEIEEMDEELRDKHFDVNVMGPWNCVKAVLPGMMKRKYGRIVTISSVTGPRVCDPANIAYATTKAALLGFSKAIAIDTAPYNITSNAILPGYFLTPMVELTAVETDPDNPQRVLDEIVETVPVGRFGKPEEIGYLAAFLASDEAAYITGSEFTIDGGSTLPETISVGR